MAFRRSKFQPFSDLLLDLRRSSPVEGKGGPAANFALEKGLADSAEDRYWECLEDPASEYGWQQGHQAYLSRFIRRWQDLPQTFDQVNRANWLPRLASSQQLVRLEQVAGLAKWANGPDREPRILMDLLSRFLKGRDAQPARGAVEKLLQDYNSNRDLRPAFAGYWGEVRDLFEAAGQTGAWADRLRDRFGLGHLNPQGGEPIPVVLFRYRLKDLLSGLGPGDGCTVVPTVLDGALNPFFFPLPRQPGGGFPQPGGFCLNLEPEAKYRLSCEVLHRQLPYLPKHIFQVGWITRPPGKDCEQARRIHQRFLLDRFPKQLGGAP
ncbi:MAG: hypothetical protein V3T83_04290 [Acidobacteriota bacterium]